MKIGNGGTGNVNSNDLTFGTGGANIPDVIRYAPGRGRNLTGYTITSITQTLNSLSITQLNPNHYNAGASSTFYIYGTAVPEPCTTVLVLVLAIHPLRLRHSLRYFDPRPSLT
jgi:hypothetical protein